MIKYYIPMYTYHSYIKIGTLWGLTPRRIKELPTPLRIESDHEYNIMMLGNIQEGGSQGKGANGGGDGQD